MTERTAIYQADLDDECNEMRSATPAKEIKPRPP
jgi:hypothetical protein